MLWIGVDGNIIVTFIVMMILGVNGPWDLKSSWLWKKKKSTTNIIVSNFFNKRMHYKFGCELFFFTNWQSYFFGFWKSSFQTGGQTSAVFKGSLIILSGSSVESVPTVTHSHGFTNINSCIICLDSGSKEWTTIVRSS